MKRIQEKVKDVVEVRPYINLQDFTADPLQTLSAYHFTDATSEMMAKWLDKAADVSIENGAAIALAGYRGVGKSHFLATFGAIIANPELRSRITDQHVGASAQRLKRRHYPVAYVRRGTRETLIEELKAALAKTLEIGASELSDSLPELLQTAATKANDLPFLLLIDTAFERASRVARDDGEMLGEIARLAKDLNIFAAAALDDDVSSADGANAAIIQNYAIDFLDQEHLYRVVDANIFPKHRQMQPLLHDIYTYFREVMPHFRWSEQRFAALYPLHPVILENAPFVRLYIQDFALLGFASEAGGKILGRPANSLIALDEVFDSIENSLRKIDVLTEAFETYDRLNFEVVGKIPVMQRLHAKLILKALLLLSLDGNGTTAGEISAAMLIYDENEPKKAIKIVEELLENFCLAMPDAIARVREEERETRYSLRASSKDDLNNALDEAAKEVPAAVIPKILRRFARDRFSDWTLDENESPGGDWTDCQTIWRGGLRRGRLSWNFENRKIDESASLNSDVLDWEIILNSSWNNTENSGDVPIVYWKPASLRNDEADTILRYYVLLTDKTLREKYGEQIQAAGHAHTIAVERIWSRMFIEEANFVIEGFDYNFTEEARAAQTLSEMFSKMLEPLFENNYPEHPVFKQTLGMTEVSALVNDLFSGARANLPEIQQLAETFALPLGLVAQHGAAFVLEKEENLAELPLVREILSLVEESKDENVSLKAIYQKLKQPPTGLVREAQHLVLTALVAQRQIEFVTTKGDRINRRSLDLKIIWDDIEGIAKPSGSVYTNQRLAEWSRVLTGSDQLRSLDTSADVKKVIDALEVWLSDWKLAQTLERFNELPDELLNTKIWRLAAHVEKTFGAVAGFVASILDKTISLEEGLHRVADAFSDSEKSFFASTKDLVTLEDFVSGVRKREEFMAYLAVCDATEDEKIEYFRERLLQVIDEGYFDPDDVHNREMENLWQSFYTRFTEHFAVKHDLVMKSHHLQEKFDEILRSDEWWEFENLSRISVFPNKYWKKAQKISRQLKDLDCRFDVREMLKTHPFCACSFSLQQIRGWEKLPQSLAEVVEEGRQNYRKILQILGKTLIPIIKKSVGKDASGEFSEAALRLTEALPDGSEIPLLTNAELIVLQKAFESLPVPSHLEPDFPIENNYLEREELRAKLNDWLDEMPSGPVLLKV
jgi:energy-coupling factor transporter ATP-binding protein EcfA2